MHEKCGKYTSSTKLMEDVLGMRNKIVREMTISKQPAEQERATDMCNKMDEAGRIQLMAKIRDVAALEEAAEVKLKLTKEVDGLK